MTTPFRRCLQLIKEVIEIVSPFLRSLGRELGELLEEVFMGRRWGAAAIIIIIIIIVKGRRLTPERRRRRR